MRTIEIDEDEYKELLRFKRFIHTWHEDDYEKCEKCGEYHPIGTICLDCDWESRPCMSIIDM